MSETLSFKGRPTLELCGADPSLTAAPNSLPDSPYDPLRPPPLTRHAGSLVGHSGWVTAIATSSENPDTILTASRDKTIIVWQLTRDEVSYGCIGEG